MKKREKNNIEGTFGVKENPRELIVKTNQNDNAEPIMLHHQKAKQNEDMRSFNQVSRED